MREFKQRFHCALLVCLFALPILAQVPGEPAPPKVPRKAPEFVINVPKGRSLLLSQYRGKVVVLELLFTTCPHCQHASQMMSKLYTELGPKGLQPLGVAWNDKADLLVPDFVRTYGVNFPVGSASQMDVYKFLDLSILQRMVVPQIVIVDRAGNIRLQTDPVKGPEELANEPVMRAKIEELLKEPAHRRPAAAQRKKKS